MDFGWLSSLWNKIGRPLPNLLIGLAFLYKAPENISWVGYIFIAISVQGFLDWGISTSKKILSIWRDYSRAAEIQKKLLSLNKEEKEIMVSLHQWRVANISSGELSSQNPQNKIELYQSLEKLHALSLLHRDVSNDLYGGKTVTYFISGEAESCLQALIEKEVKKAKE